MSAARFRIIFYRTSAGRCQACDYARGMDVHHRVKASRWFVELSKQGPNLPRDYAKYLRDGIWELRVSIVGHQHRFLFACRNEVVIVTNAFLKKSKRVPEEEIERARAAASDWIDKRGWEAS